jgi:HAD superfamily hydrolase (TIGR01509 family)
MFVKAIIFDLDGVLFDGVDLHFKSFNKALSNVDEKYMISSADEHKFNGIPTRMKLKKLTEERGLPSECHQRVWEQKQRFFLESISSLGKDTQKIHLMSELKRLGYKIAVASNSIAATVKDVLVRKELAEYVDLYLSNDDVTHPKPDPEIYIESVKRLGVTPLECIIVEDSFVGKTAANASGCHVFPVRNPDDVILEHVLNYVTYINNGGDTKKLNIVIPMAGLGSRFANVGYKLPKPLIDVNGKPMIRVVVENMNINAHYVFIAMKKHVEEYDVENVIKEVTCGNYTIYAIDELTEGSACTVLKVRDIIDNDNPMMLANSDQYLEWDPYEFLVKTQGVDGLISCFEADHPKWSYAKTDIDGKVTEVAEKKVISNLATTGLYYFAKGSQFVRCADSMISKNIRTNGEFYNCPIYNEVILEGGVVKTHMCSKMWGIGVPEDLDYYLQNFGA